MMESGRYYAAVTTDDVWICYPWEAKYVLYSMGKLDHGTDIQSGILMNTMPWRRRIRSFKRTSQFSMHGRTAFHSARRSDTPVAILVPSYCCPVSGVELDLAG